MNSVTWALNHFSTRPENKAWMTGLVGLGILAAYIVIPSLLPESHTESPKRYTTGLVNTGNDCYANSTFQALASLRTLEEFLTTSKDEGKPWVHKLAEVLEEIRQEDSRTPQRRSIWPALRLIEVLCQARMSRSQQDAHELLVKILELLESEEAEQNPFSGVLTDVIKCQRCGHTTKKDTQFLVLERFPGEEILKSQSELISDYRCSECGPGTTVIEKTTRISKIPRILAVHINRSSYTNASFRNSQAIDIPLHLGLLQELQLRAVVFHKGNHYRGHYTAARKKTVVNKEQKRRPWWLISDDSVKEGTTKQVVSRNTEAYILFYETHGTNAATRQKTLPMTAYQQENDTEEIEFNTKNTQKS